MRCKPPYHVDEQFPCERENCNIRPFLCKGCAYTSNKDNALMCRLCRVTEKMDDFNVDDLEVDNDPSSHTIVCIASVSYDRQKAAFKYSGDHEGVFGQETA